jgi:hypothetical protein
VNPTERLQNLDKFDDLLVKVIDETIKYCLGEANALILYNYLEKKSCSLDEIPERLEVFSMELRNMLGFGRRQIYGAASILEETIAEALCLRLKLPYDEKGPIVFADYIKELKKIYRQETEEGLCTHVRSTHADNICTEAGYSEQNCFSVNETGVKTN